MNAPVPLSVLREPAVFSELQLQICGIRLQAEGIHAFDLAHPEGDELPEVEAGAHVDVHLPGGLMRSYSLAGDPRDRSRWTLGVLREAKGRGGSRAMHEKVRVGEMITVGAPRNAFALHDEAKHSILLAGGIGITPIKSMAHTLVSQGKSFELHYCARSARHAAFANELQEFIPKGRLHFHFDGGDPAKGLNINGLLGEQVDGQHVYFCGPGGFMKACADAAKHWQAGTVHSEHFKPPETPKDDLATSGSFEVKLARSGITVQVQPDQTIVRAIELAGQRVPTSCLSGLCGACKVDYLEGEVDHKDFILSDEEKSRCLTVCCSRAKSSCLVLDL
ncbi:PDR/VanB family oxidoreductase [Variovorax paradoxus]|uniref:PDR/VanB family oxidoreductase n=1 Tax=Variovorax paradoxus TaxID=34073 RepID=UPI00399B1B58